MLNKIMHLSAVDFGGAGKAAYRLHSYLSKAGFDSRFLVGRSQTGDNEVVQASKKGLNKKSKIIFSKIWHKLTGNNDYYFQNQHVSTFDSDATSGDGFIPDLIMVYSMSGFVSFDDLGDLFAQYNAPIILYLMDMAPLTGGCHYAWDCLKYVKSCGDCPALLMSHEKDLSHSTMLNKKSIMQRSNIEVLAASSWLYNQARISSLYKKSQIDLLLLSVDDDIFHPIKSVACREKLREKLGIPIGKKVVFFGNQSLKLKRKGIKALDEAFHILAKNKIIRNDELLVLIAGNKDIEFEWPYQTRFLGFLNSEKDLAEAYQASDLFLCPSIEDSGPMMINESIMCGVPVVCFDMGVAADLVINLQTGFVAELGNSRQLAVGIETILQLTAQEKELMDNKCRKLALSKCHPSVSVEWIQQRLGRETNRLSDAHI